jgi:hypothetical protein
MAHRGECLLWEDVRRLSRTGLQEFLQTPFPDGPGLESEFVSNYFRKFDGQVLADLNGAQDLRDAGLPATQADRFWTYLECFKLKRPFKSRRIEVVGRCPGSPSLTR